MTAYSIWYTKPEAFRDFIFGDKLPTLATLCDTHTYLRVIEAASLDDAFARQQAERWSPNGEARPLIEARGLSHTSMSVGDVIRQPALDPDIASPDDVYWVVAPVGFKRID